MITIITKVEFKDGLLDTKTELTRSETVNHVEASVCKGLLGVMNHFIRVVAEESGDADLTETEVKVRDLPKA